MTYRVGDRIRVTARNKNEAESYVGTVMQVTNFAIWVKPQNAVHEGYRKCINLREVSMGWYRVDKLD